MHLCIDEICGRKGPSYSDYKSTTSWTNEDYDAAVSYVQSFCCNAVKEEWKKHQIVENLTALDDGSCKQLFAENLEIRRNDIIAVFTEKTCAVSGLHLQDFDWKLKYVMGSSKLPSLREPLVGVTLHLAENPGCNSTRKSCLKTLELEFNSQEFKPFVEELEKALNSAWQL